MGRVRGESCNGVLVLVVASLFVLLSLVKAENFVTCFNQNSPCFTKKLPCPSQCPSTFPNATSPKVCHLNCLSPVCAAECRNRKPNCNGPGSACLDPRFIGGDGIVFYFHGKRDEHYALVSDRNLHINARFIGLRPQGRTRDFTWIQALGILFASAKNFTLEAKRASTWDDDTDLLKLSFGGREISLPETVSSSWECRETGFKVERISDKNSVAISIPGEVEISVNVVPITKEDDRVHSYRIPEDNCFAHLEVQFRFLGLSSQVEGVLGRTYSPDFENPAKAGVAMPIMGGEDKYWTPSLLSASCGFCKFSYEYKSLDEEEKVGRIIGKGSEVLDCRRNGLGGNGLVCKK